MTCLWPWQAILCHVTWYEVGQTGSGRTVSDDGQQQSTSQTTRQKQWLSVNRGDGVHTKSIQGLLNCPPPPLEPEFPSLLSQEACKPTEHQLHRCAGTRTLGQGQPSRLREWGPRWWAACAWYSSSFFSQLTCSILCATELFILNTLQTGDRQLSNDYSMDCDQTVTSIYQKILSIFPFIVLIVNFLQLLCLSNPFSENSKAAMKKIDSVNYIKEVLGFAGVGGGGYSQSLEILLKIDKNLIFEAL